MNYEQQYFIKVLSDHLSGQTSEQPSELDWSIITNLSRSHQVDGIVYYQCKNFMPKDIHESFKNAYSSTIYIYANRKALVDRIINAVKMQGIFIFLVKGFIVANNYPIPALRTMGDSDIVVNREDVAYVNDILKSMGFNSRGSILSEQCGFNKMGLHFEIHDRLVQEGEYATNRQMTFFNNFNGYVNESGVDLSFHFLFLLMHLRKHFLNRGVGIRQFMDLAVEIQRNDNLNWNWIENTLSFLELKRFAHKCYALIEFWFGIKAPVEYEMLNNTVINQVTGKILNDGVFGFEDKLNQNVDAHTALIITRGPLWFRRLSTIWKKVFLSYEIMRGYEDCQFVDGKPWLMPVAWVKRFYSIIRRNDNSRTLSVIKNSFTSKSELVEREELLEMMGLL